MKKVLIYLQSLLLTTTPFLSTISCNKTLGKSTRNKLNPPGVISEQEKEIIKNTSLFTKLLLLSRHENLNFNSTDVLNSVFAPKTTWNAFPRVYTVNGKNYNLTDYTDKLTTEYSNLGKLNSTDFDPFFASTLTGMYDDKLYQNYVNQPKNKKNDIFGYFKENTTEITAKLSDKFDRQQLAWANFTGPLSKYIVDKQLINYKDVEYTNEVPLQYYGRFLDIVKKAEKHKLLLDEIGMKVKDDTNNEMQETFGEYQAKLFNKQNDANFSAKILDFLPFIQNFNETASGAAYGLKLLNNLFPFTDTKTDMDATYAMFYLLQNSIDDVKRFSKLHKIDNAQEINQKGIEIFGLFRKLNINFLNQIMTPTMEGFKVQMIMKKEDENGNNLNFFNAIKDFKNLVSNSAKQWDENTKIEYLKSVKKSLNLFINPKIVPARIVPFMKEIINSLNSADDTIEMFSILGDLIGVIADHQDKFIAIDNNPNYKDKDFDTLTKAQQQEITNLLGFKDNKFEEGSVLDELNKVFKNKTFNKVILDPESPIYKFNSENGKAIHEQLLQYALDDKYWTIDKKSFKLVGAISGDKSKNAKFSYSLEYKGKGDKTVTKFLDQPVNLPNNFNPIEPWLTPTDVSKSWTKQDYIDYTGLGNGGNDGFKDVNFKYNVEWSNVSGEPEFPYWVITKINCFRNENGTWKQFYPVI